MTQEFYKELDDLIDIHNNCFTDEEKITCFQIIKDIIENKVYLKNFSTNEIKRIRKQLNDSILWLECMGVSVEYKNIYVEILSDDKLDHIEY